MEHFWLWDTLFFWFFLLLYRVLFRISIVNSMILSWTNSNTHFFLLAFLPFPPVVSAFDHAPIVPTPRCKYYQTLFFFAFSSSYKNILHTNEYETHPLSCTVSLPLNVLFYFCVCLHIANWCFLFLHLQSQNSVKLFIF